MDSGNNPRITNFTDLTAWQESHKLALLTYRFTKNFPAEERFSLVDQMRRASVSVTSNIAEGFSRNTSKDKAQFYTMAIGSLHELHSQLLLARDLEYISSSDFKIIAQQAESATRLTNKLKTSAYKLADFSPHTTK